MAVSGPDAWRVAPAVLGVFGQAAGGLAAPAHRARRAFRAVLGPMTLRAAWRSVEPGAVRMRGARRRPLDVARAIELYSRGLSTQQVCRVSRIHPQFTGALGYDEQASPCAPPDGHPRSTTS